MKRSFVLDTALLGLIFLVLMAVTVYAKETPADGNIPLTSEYFPDEWFLTNAKVSYDKNHDGFLSSEEIAAITDIWCDSDLTDFSQIQYFTNLRKLRLAPSDEGDMKHDIWAGAVIDLTVFRNLEDASLFLDSRKAPSGVAAIQIKVSGLEHLKRLRLCDRGLSEDVAGSDMKARIGVIDLRDTKELEYVRISDAQGVVFDDVNRIRELALGNMETIPVQQIGGFHTIEDLYMDLNLPTFTRLDVSGNRSLAALYLKNDYLESVELSGADALHALTVKSGMMRTIVLPQNHNLAKLELECASLKSIEPAKLDGLVEVAVTSDALCEIDFSKNKNLKNVFLKCPKLKTLGLWENKRLERLGVVSDKMISLDISKNTALASFEIYADKIRVLDLTKNKKLEYISVKCKRLAALDLSANRKVKRLEIDGTPLKSLNLSGQKNLTRLSLCGTKNLTRLDLSGNARIEYLCIKNTPIKSLDISKLAKLYWLELHGNQKLRTLDLSKNRNLFRLETSGHKKLVRLDLSKNRHLSTVIVNDNALETLKFAKEPAICYLDCSKNNLTKLNLSKVIYLTELVCDKKVKVKGYKGKITRV